MTGDFNIRDSNWDPLYPFHLIHSNLLVDIANAFDISLSLDCCITVVETYCKNNGHYRRQAYIMDFLRGSITTEMYFPNR